MIKEKIIVSAYLATLLSSYIVLVYTIIGAAQNGWKAEIDFNSIGEGEFELIWLIAMLPVVIYVTLEIVKQTNEP